VLSRPGIADYLCYSAVFTHDESDPLDQLVHEQIRDLDLVEAAEFQLRIGQQVKRQPLGLAECDVRVRGVRADAENHGVVPDELSMQVAEPASFRSSTGSALTGEEVEHDILLSDEVFQPDNPAVLRAHCKERRKATDGQHLPLLTRRIRDVVAGSRRRHGLLPAGSHARPVPSRATVAKVPPFPALCYHPCSPPDAIATAGGARRTTGICVPGIPQIT
jgi:hypothetical protein